MMLSNDGFKSSLSRTDSSDEEYYLGNTTPTRINTSNTIPNGHNADLECSGVFVAGYTGPIHKWEHPGYQFLTESAQVTTSTVERIFKIIIVGDATVGKTSFVQRYVNDIFRKDYKGTVGVDFAMKVLWKSDKEVIKLQLWDIAGQERFTWMTRVYYKDAQGCIVMFDLNKRSTFLSAMKWKKDVDAKCHLSDGSLLPSILLGNKCDLPVRDVNQEEIEYAYRKGNYIGWTEVSAKEGLMVDDCMKFLVDAMINKDGGRVSVRNEQSTVDLVKTKKKRSCCK
ncbi:ras-related protein Rab-7L1 [Parasteatoda tepidariorum]|uniref:ras-related protein Rab-7L1 n=1 Tax=Parasteatoda tepidariorum TaxID=114398 RepID=UPI00077F9B53|nr:ras-related protein Rab-7L1 [Parasteatoda tepidariorum]XP_015919074.1 ras-related protein Rab-7L1 [Parasteatoda tepidariorum]XP_015919075.1 ras-related protein Rab-7L1 [Parasteatoda tepidariorum]